MKKDKVLIYGGSGQIGSQAIKILSEKFTVIAPTHKDVDVTNKTQVINNIIEVKPDQILYAAGFTNIDQAKEKLHEAYALCSGAVDTITSFTSLHKIPFHYLSTEIVFNGKQSDRPYNEEDQTDPESLLATLKRLGEQVTLKSSPLNCVIRLIVCYSPVYPRKKDLARLALNKVKSGEPFTATTDQIINPTFVDDLIWALGAILKNHGSGLYHIGATTYISPYEFAKKMVRSFQLDDRLILPTTFAQFSKTRPEPRPQYEWLDTKKFVRDFGQGILHTVDEGIELFIKDCQPEITGN